MAGINTSMRWPQVIGLTSLTSANPLCPHTWLTWMVACVGSWVLGWLASVFTQLGTEMVWLNTKKNIVLSYPTELEGKYRVVISNRTYIPEKTILYHNIVPNHTVLHALGNFYYISVDSKAVIFLKTYWGSTVLCSSLYPVLCVVVSDVVIDLLDSGNGWCM